MKKINKLQIIYKILFFSIFLSSFTLIYPMNVPALSVEKKKSYYKNYILKKGDKILLENQFGEIKITNWDKNEISVDVEIIVKGKNELEATNILNSIHIEDSKTSNQVKFITEVNKCIKNYENMGSCKVQINYDVKVPQDYQLSASNSYGGILMEDYSGELDLESKFGSIIAGNLNNPKSIYIEFGKANIKSMNNGSIEAKYSSVDIQDVINELKGVFDFCENVDLKINPNAKNIYIDGSYSEIILMLDKKLKTDFLIESSFGNFKNSSNYSIILLKPENDFNHTKIYKSSPTLNSKNKISVKNSFGKIYLK